LEDLDDIPTATMGPAEAAEAVVLGPIASQNGTKFAAGGPGHTSEMPVKGSFNDPRKPQHLSGHTWSHIVFSGFYHEYTSQYLVHLWIVTVLSLATFIKFYYLYKAILLAIMFALYSALIVTLMTWTSGM